MMDQIGRWYDDQPRKPPPSSVLCHCWFLGLPGIGRCAVSCSLQRTEDIVNLDKNPQNSANDVHDAISNCWVDDCFRSGFASSNDNAYVLAVPPDGNPEQDSDWDTTTTMHRRTS